MNKEFKNIKFAWNNVLTVAIDFDGVIVDFNFPGIGKIKPYCKEILQSLKDRLNCRIIIYSARTDLTYPPNENGVRFKEMLNFLKENNIPYDDVWVKAGKPVADIYIDDKAITFTSWPEVYKEIYKKLLKGNI